MALFQHCIVGEPFLAYNYQVEILLHSTSAIIYRLQMLPGTLEILQMLPGTLEVLIWLDLPLF